jgi:hypothetical protein
MSLVSWEREGDRKGRKRKKLSEQEILAPLPIPTPTLDNNMDGSLLMLI